MTPPATACLRLRGPDNKAVMAMERRSPRISRGPARGLALAAVACMTVAGLAQETPPLLTSLRALEERSVGEIWPVVEELKRAHQADAEALKSLAGVVFSLGGKVKLAGAAILFGRKEPSFQQNGQVAIQQLARDAKEKPVRIAAIRLLRKSVRFEEAFLTLKDVAQAATDPEIKIEATVSLWELDNEPSIRLPIVKMLDDPRPDIRTAAALALAETGYYQPPVDEMLRAISREPSDSGKYAKALLRAADRQGAPPPKLVEPKPERQQAAAGNGAGAGADASAWRSLLAEVEGLILKQSLYSDKIGTRDLYLAAIRGMVASLDEYSAFQDPDDFRQAEASRLGTFWGLCADLVKPGKSAPLVVAKPHRGGPAFEAGIRTGDRILEVNGVTTHDRDRLELERLTSGERGEDVQLLISRWGWVEPRMVSVKRGEVEVPLVRSQLLPERIGYIKLSQVGPTASVDFEKALDELEKSGLIALVIDLRDNTGGNLKQAVRIADLFIPESTLPIVIERSPSRVTEWSTSPGEKPRHPTAVLVNQLTASAAEVIAGALQDFQRAFLVGQPTFGKGLKQASLPLPPAFAALLGGESRLVITTGRLYLPSGRPIQAERPKGVSAAGVRQGGLEPDVKVEGGEDGASGRQVAEVLRVQYSAQVGEYIHRNFTAMKHLFDEGDVWDPAHYPGFEDLYLSLGTKLSRPDVRQAVRVLVRRRLEEESGEDAVGNYRDDLVLQKAILELLRRMGRDPSQAQDYRGIAEQESHRNAVRGE